MVLMLFGLLFLLSDHAMSSIISLMGIVLVYFYFSFSSSSSVWYGLVMVLVMLSGVLVIFTYMVSLIPNDKFELFNVFYGLLFTVLMIMIYNMDVLLGWDISFLSLKLWELDFMIYLMFGLGFLLLIMLFVIEIVGKFMGALRVE
uniref:NADH dehydrogenase subunit 6 n=1 Tax=Parachtes romandiolae TaxID=1110492 RepID=A0A516IMB5_9ARAC|nr:NADH dehydrogenase subunit 6 [Parachtes romandiolae]QDP17914.1 NADH dehydrogenase subunit 6 [Parachtes romandiolae]